MHSVHIAALKGGHWYYGYQSIKGLSYEVNIRGLRKELVLEL